MKYADFIKGNEGFQYSINIQYDFMNLNKIKGYIPTRKSIEILKEYLLNTIVDDRDKSTVLIGPYGKGKSHLLLILLGLMCGSNDIKELNDLVNKIKYIDNTCAEFAEDVLSNKKYLPIIVNFNSGDLNQAFLIAVNKALKIQGIQNILPNTYFDSVLSVLESWEKYDQTISLVESLIKEKTKFDLNTFKRKLKSFDTFSYEVFKEIFKVVTSGIEFNPLINTDVVKLYEEINHILKEQYGFNGMIIVFDEFSKFIEASVDINSAMNLKILQDFAEVSNRLKDPQIHLVCVTHKTINEYISKIPQEKIDAWRAIEGRFKEILFNSSSQQNYDLISNAIVKDINKVKEVLIEKDLYKNKSVYSAKNLFKYDENEYTEHIIEGCFPLSPYSTYILPIISEKVAQNERTLFTYLSKEEKNSLIELLANKNEFDLVTIDKLYEYFEPLFRKETFNEAIYNIWLKTDTALKIVYSEEEKRVIKALGILYIVNDFNSLPPTEKVISNVLNMDKSVVESTIKNLRHLNILILRRSTETLDFIPITSVDIKGKIDNLVSTKFKLPNLSETYNELVNLKYLLPKKYNDTYKMTRFFKRTFMTINQIMAYMNAEKLLSDYETDGIIIDLIYENSIDKEKVNKWLDEIDDNRIIVTIPKEVIKIKEDISEYEAISYLKADEEFLKEDSAIESQLDILFEDVVQKISDYINKVYDISQKNSFIYINNKRYSGLKPYKLSAKLSKICTCNFLKSPIINNELINKQEITAPIKKARNIIIDMILNKSYLDFDSSKNAPECTLFRATLLNKGLLEEEKYYNEDIKLILSEIKDFIFKCKNKEISFGELYRSLTSNEKKIGMRKGVLPIYLAFILKDYKEEAIIYLKNGRSKKEVVLDSTIIENINTTPNDYLIKVEKVTEEKDLYISSLLNMFSKYLNKKSNNNYVDIVNGMRRWMQSLSLYSQNHQRNINSDEYLRSEIINLRKELVKYEINYRGFIFNDLLKYLNVDSYHECINELKDIKEYLDTHDEKVRQYLINETNKIIDSNYKGSLSGNLNTWYSSLSDEQKGHLYNTETNDLLRFIQKSNNNEIDIINNLVYIFSNLAVEDWNDNSINVYLNGIRSSKEQVENYELSIDSDNNNGLVKIVFESDDSETIEKTFNKVEVSPLGSTLCNAIEEIIEEYGDSVNDNEKRNILMDILSNYI
ncbi:hypothetical protein H9660_05440 [Clostridium sp. Sa3CUN1]|uniref:Uncharacterized protein n=1 Tax=Clostridium gallinarum TaxID=2762246 RepID=A0ABR8Q2C8_9CLOT|nr:hypothetical protein [Clostridium gallinarum]MBD7914582.1 hypothetical protein [Clostridium gallinarum]